MTTNSFLSSCETCDQTSTANEFLAEVCSCLGMPPVEKHIPYRLAYAAAWLMEMAAKFSGTTPRLSRYAVRVVGLPRIYVADKTEKELGFKLSLDLIDGIRRCLSQHH